MPATCSLRRFQFCHALKQPVQPALAAQLGEFWMGFPAAKEGEAQPGKVESVQQVGRQEKAHHKLQLPIASVAADHGHKCAIEASAIPRGGEMPLQRHLL